MRKTITWFSRHDPTPRQRAELERLFPGAAITIDRRTFRDADDIIARHRGDEMVVVAPLSVIQALVDRGIRPLWPEMEKIPPGAAAEVTMRRRDGRLDHYRFVQFRRVVSIEIRFEEV